MKTLISFVGKLGSGKNYCMNKKVDELKDTGHTLYLISFADPIKKILRDSFGLTKSGKLSTKYPEFTEIYVKAQVVDSMYKLIKELNYEKFDISESDLKAFIARNYEKYEKEFFGYIQGAVYGEIIDSSWYSTKTDYAFCFRRLGQMLGTELGRYLIDSIWVDIAINKIKRVFKEDLADYAFIADVRFLNEFNVLEDFKNTTAFDSLIYGVSASDITRSRRRGMTLEELELQDDHGSEQEVDKILSKIKGEFLIINEDSL